MTKSAHHLRTLALLCTYLVATFLINIKPISAQPTQESSITAMPVRLGDDFSLRAKPGEKLQTSVRVRNSNPYPITLQTIAQDFIVDANGGTPIPIEDVELSNRWSLASWVVTTPNIHALEPDEIATVNVLIDVPNNALPGGHYAMITHQPAINPNTDPAHEPTSGSILQQQVGTLLYVVVDGPINESAFIRHLTLPSFTEYGPVPFSFEVDNQSDVHLQPQIGVEIYNLFGKKVDTLVVESKNVFPLVPRRFEGQWSRIWGFGPYTARVVMSYGSAGQVSMAETRFWLLPIKLFIAFLIFVLLLIAIMISLGRYLRRRQVRQANTTSRKNIDQFDT